VSGLTLVVPGTFQLVEPAPASLWDALMAVPRGIEEGAGVIITILFVGGAFALLDRTGALARLVGALVGRRLPPRLVVVLLGSMFAILGGLENMHEEIIALVPVLLVLSRGLGYGAVTALGMSVGAAVVGSAFSPTNPFGAGLAFKYADLPQLTSGGLRLTLFVVAVGVWLGWTLWQTPKDDVRPDVTAPAPEPVRRRDLVLLALVIVPFGPYVYGVLALDWGFNELSALFLVAGLLVGLVSGLDLRTTTIEYLKGMETMLVAGLFVGVARGISVVLTDGRIIDTIVHGLAQPLEGLPGFAAASLMVPIQALLHVPVISNSGQAVLTMPIMAPVADLIGIPRDAVVMAYQTGAILMDSITPTNGALLAMLLAARVSYGRWLRFVIPGVLLVSLVGFAGIAILVS
jgi:uncharacterized ion transporter superfamily protein YfcC